MRLDLINNDGTKIPIANSEYFTLTDIDGMTEGDVSIESSELSGADGDYINSQTVNARDITLTLRFKDTIPVEETRRHILKYFKLKKNATLELEYKSRTTRLTGTVQSIEIPRFNFGVTAQISIHCSSPFWEDTQTMYDTISDVIPMHTFPIHPTEEEPIVMGEMTDTNQVRMINNGDVGVGMIITVVATGAISNPKIMRDKTSEFIEIAISMNTGDELVISTIRGNKTVMLNGNSVINKLVSGSTWLELDVGANDFVSTNSVGGDNMTVNISAREKYL